MQDFNPYSWYRIPGYNGYEYCIAERNIRSWKNARKNRGMPTAHILKRYGCASEYYWYLTDDSNERCTIRESEIANILKSSNNVVDGTGGCNLSARRHLTRRKGQRQNPENYAVPDDTPYIPDFSELIVKEEK